MARATEDKYVRVTLLSRKPAEIEVVAYNGFFDYEKLKARGYRFGPSAHTTRYKPLKGWGTVFQYPAEWEAMLCELLWLESLGYRCAVAGGLVSLMRALVEEGRK